jgi:hypothetical protein
MACGFETMLGIAATTRTDASVEMRFLIRSVRLATKK